MKCMAIPMTTANVMLKESTVTQLKQAINDIGGAINFQVKYQGKACKSYLIPQSFLTSRVYSKLQECRSTYVCNNTCTCALKYTNLLL